MATEKRRRHREPSVQSDSLQSGTRPCLTDASAVLTQAASNDAVAPDRARTIARSGIRPSAFGIPRQHASEPANVTTVVERIASPAARASSNPPAPSAPPHAPRAQVAGPRGPAIKTDIEELLPLSPAAKSLPRPPRLPTFESAQHPPTTARRFPWMSLSIFAIVLAASLTPLLRYRGERSAGSARRELTSSSEVEIEVGSLTPLTERMPWGEPSATIDQLLADGERALRVGQAGEAEHAFGQALSLGTGAPGPAFGLARTRRIRGDLHGARAWAEAALGRRPQEASYRAFLQQLGRSRPR
jgi:hypothetical protein